MKRRPSEALLQLIGFMIVLIFKQYKVVWKAFIQATSIKRSTSKSYETKFPEKQAQEKTEEDIE